MSDDDELTPSERIDRRIAAHVPPRLTGSPPRHAFQRAGDNMVGAFPARTLARAYTELGDLKSIARDKGWNTAFDWIQNHQANERVDLSPNWSPEERARAAHRLYHVFEGQLKDAPMDLAMQLCEIGVEFVLDKLGWDPLATDPEEAAEAQRDPGSVQALLRGVLEGDTLRPKAPVVDTEPSGVCRECGEPKYRVHHPGDSWHYTCPNGHNEIVGK